MAKDTQETEITDILLDDFDKFETFAMKYWKEILIVCGIIIVVVGIGAVATQVMKNNLLKAKSAIADADSVEKLKKVIVEYNTYPQANAARLRLASMLQKEKKYDDAIKQLEMLLRTDVSKELTWRARLNIAYIAELKGEKEFAASKFSAMGAESSLPDAMRAEANYGAGRIYSELNKVSEAKNALQRMKLTAAYERAANFWIDQSKSLLKRLNLDSKATPEKKVAKPKVSSGKANPKKAKPAVASQK